MNQTQRQSDTSMLSIHVNLYTTGKNYDWVN